MPNTLKLLIPIGLGVIAAFINYIVLTSSTKSVKFITPTKELSAGDSFEGVIEFIDVPADMAAKLREKGVAIEWRDKGELSGHTAVRPIGQGDIILYRDVNIKAGGFQIRTFSESAKSIRLDNHSVAGSKIGDYLRLTIPKLEQIVNGGDDFRVNFDTETIGDFRIIGIGDQTSPDPDEGQYTYRAGYVTVAYENKPKSNVEAEQFRKLAEFLKLRGQNDNRDVVRILDLEIIPEENYDTIKKLR